MAQFMERGEKLTLTAICTIITCRCGADLGDLAQDIEEREGRPPHKLTQPWFDGTQVRG